MNYSHQYPHGQKITLSSQKQQTRIVHTPERTPLQPKMLNVSELIISKKTQKPQPYSNLDLKKFKRDDFEFGTKLGKGKFGDVYIAREKRTNFIVAIKILNKSIIRQLKAQKQVIREIKIHSYLNHPNIIKLYGVFHDDENVYMILEYAPGGEVYKELKASVFYANYFLEWEEI